jgi:hypothetical protein
MEAKMANGRDLKLILKKVYNHESLVGIDLAISIYPLLIFPV